jgi:hypothetical protein
MSCQCSSMYKLCFQLQSLSVCLSLSKACLHAPKAVVQLALPSAQYAVGR